MPNSLCYIDPSCFLQGCNICLALHKWQVKTTWEWQNKKKYWQYNEMRSKISKIINNQWNKPSVPSST